MKIEVIGNEEPEGYNIEVAMNGKIELKYIPKIVKLLLDGIACQGEEVEMAVVIGIADFMEKKENYESIF